MTGKKNKSGFDENYFLGIKGEEAQPGKKHFVLIIYDISDNKKRRQMVKVLESYGVRVQRSAFEAILKPSQYKKMLRKIALIPEEQDSVRVYKIQKTSSVDVFGKPFTLEENETIII